VLGVLFVGREECGTWLGAIRAADFDGEPSPGFTSEGVGVIDASQYSFQRTWTNNRKG
jgi:hypothetical protein